MSPYTAHVDQLAAVSPKDCGSFVEEPVKTSSEAFKAIVLDYYATGEGASCTD